MAGPPPTFDAPHFTCPHETCQVDANMRWVTMKDQNNHGDPRIRRALCNTCGQPNYWVDEELVWPAALLGDQASEDLPGDVLAIYSEARTVVPHSARAAAALLRLAIEHLVTALGEEGGTLNERIGRLAERGDINKRTIAALDAVRITGNKAVHEGQIDPAGGDDLEVALQLFSLVNRIAEQTLGMDRTARQLGGGDR